MLVFVAVPIAVYALTAAAIAAVRSARGMAPDRTLVGTTILLELALLGQALGAAIAVAAGHDVGEPVPFGAYLAGSVIALPAAALYAGRENDRWDTAVLAVVCVAIAAIVLRLLAIW